MPLRGFKFDTKVWRRGCIPTTDENYLILKPPPADSTRVR